MICLEAMMDTASGILFLHPARFETNVHAAQELLCLIQVSARLHPVTGLLASCHFLVLLCMFYLCPLSIRLTDHFHMRVNQSTKLIHLLSPVVQSSLVFWYQGEQVSHGVPLHPPAPTHGFTMDTSNYGWRAVCGPLSMRSIWSRDHLGLHINYLDLETVFLTLNSRGDYVKHMS